MRRCLLALVSFSLCASSVYLFNDLLDLPSDRKRAQTATKPLASGEIRPLPTMVLQAALLVAAIAIGFQLTRGFLLLLMGYYLLMCAYSLALKQMVVLDVLVLATGYCLRVGAGAAVVSVRPSAWLIALCGSLFMSLALLKRYAELISTEAVAGAAAPVRGYVAADAPIIAVQGIASGYVSVLVLALYTTTDLVQTRYAHQQVFWWLCVLLLYWVTYMWLMARRGRIPHDPVMFALRDRTSLVLGIGMGIAALAAAFAP